MSEPRPRSIVMSIARLMIVVASFAFVGLGIRRFYDASHVTADSSGTIDSFECFLDALKNMSIGGCIGGIGLRKAVHRKPSLRSGTAVLTIAAGPILLASCLMPEVLMQEVWGFAFYALPCLWILNFEIDPPIVQSAPLGSTQEEPTQPQR